MTAAIRPLFPPTIDSTILSTFRACPQKAFRQYIEHWKPKSESVHLVAGKAFASGLEASREAFYINGMGQEDAEGAGMVKLIKEYGEFQCPSDSAKSLERMCGALEFYFANYPLGADGAEPITLPGGGRGIEFSFAEPLPVAHPTLGSPILYTGRSDMVAHRLGGIYVYDDKTTSSLGASWGRQWEMRSQFTGYIWALAQHGVKANGALIRGVSILKTKYDTLEISTNRSPYEIERWHDQTVRDIERMKKMWEEGYWDYNLDGSCTDYGGCPLVQVCKSSTPENWLPVNFQQRVWDPLERKEVTVAEYEAAWGHVREAGAPEAAGAAGELLVSDEMNNELQQMMKK